MIQFSKYFTLILILLNVLVFGQAITHQLVWDDHAFIVNQDYNRLPPLSSLIDGSFPVPDTGSYRPVRNLVYAILLPIFKGNPAYHHFFILALHIVCSLQVYYLLKRLLGNGSAARWGALLFAVHPIHSESINWVTAGYDLIFVSLFLAALIAHLQYKMGENIRRWVVYLLVFLAMLTNEIALTLPLVILLVDYHQNKLPPKKSAYLNAYGIYWLLAALYWLIRMNYITQNPFATTVYPTLAGNAVLGFYVFGQYLLQLILPVSLSVDRLFLQGLSGLYSLNHSLVIPPPQLALSNPLVFLPIMGGVIWLGLGFLSFIKKSNYTLPLLWVPISLLAVLRIVPLPAIYSERYAYLASVGFVLLLATIIKPQLDRPKIKPVITILLLVYLGFFMTTSVNRTQDWRNDFILWTKTLAQNPQSASAASSLGVQYFIQGDLEKSLFYHKQAITVNPYVSSYQQNYVSILAKLQKYDDIIDFIHLIQKTDQKNINLYTILASTYDAKGDYQPAMASYQKAYDLSPVGSKQRSEIEKLVEDLDHKYKVVDESP